MQREQKTGFMIHLNKFCIAICLSLLSYPLTAQQRGLTIKEAMSLAGAQQPQLRAQKEETKATGYNVAQARNSLVPELTAGYQAGYATYNNVTGMTYPGSFLPISGPPVTGNTYDPVPGSVLTALLKWNPLTFGQRQAAVDKASAQYRLAASKYNDALFRQQYLVISTYLDAVYLLKLSESYRANRERTKTGLTQSLVLAKEGLRPGIDTAQFQAALAQTEMDLLGIQSRYFELVAELARLTALPETPEMIRLEDTVFFRHLPSPEDTTAALSTHPLWQYYQSRQSVTAAALKEIQRGWRPRLDLWANAYARGSGVAADGSIHKADGWSLSHKNYGAGIQLSFPVFDFAQVNIRKKQYQSLLLADAAQLDQVALDLRKQKQMAQFNFEQHLQIAQQSLVQSSTARFAFDGLKLSYESGLIDFTRLVQGQYELLKAETAQAGAFVQTWRSLLDIAVAKGDLKIFIDRLK